MRKIIVLSMITLDGVMQAPGGPGEDTSGGFEYGGWVAPFGDDAYDNAVKEELEPASDYLLGRKTFEIWAGYWPKHAEHWPGINQGMKYVYSEKLDNTDPLITGWEHSAVISSPEDIRELKSQNGPDIQVWGSSRLVQLLLKHDLADELRLKIHPILLGKGKKLFDDGAVPAAFSLAGSKVTPGGVIIAHYQRAGEVQTGQAGA